jgi:hypothetical protein
MTCPGCCQETPFCVVGAAGPECPTPVCVECVEKELRRVTRLGEVVEHREEKARHTTRVFNPLGHYEGDEESLRRGVRSLRLDLRGRLHRGGGSDRPPARGIRRGPGQQVEGPS